MKIWNFTPHAINIYSPADAHPDSNGRKLILNSDAEPIIVIPSDGVLNAKIDYTPTNIINGIQIFEPVVNSVDDLPPDFDPENGYAIVSALFLTAAKIVKPEVVSRLLTVSQPVYDSESNPRPIGCIGLNKAL